MDHFSQREKSTFTIHMYKVYVCVTRTYDEVRKASIYRPLVRDVTHNDFVILAAMLGAILKQDFFFKNSINTRGVRVF